MNNFDLVLWISEMRGKFAHFHQVVVYILSHNKRPGTPVHAPPKNPIDSFHILIIQCDIYIVAVAMRGGEIGLKSIAVYMLV